MDKLPLNLLEKISNELPRRNARAFKKATRMPTRTGIKPVLKRLLDEVGTVKYQWVNLSSTKICVGTEAGNIRTLSRLIGFHIKKDTFTKEKICSLIRMYNKEYNNNVRRYHFLQFRKYLRANGAARRYSLSKDQVIALENAYCYNVQKFDMSATGAYPMKRIVDSYKKFLVTPPVPIYKTFWSAPVIPAWLKMKNIKDITDKLETQFINKEATMNAGGGAQAPNVSKDPYHHSKKYKMPK